jgi:membrane protein YdbS with pleckstrin-like domain
MEENEEPKVYQDPPQKEAQQEKEKPSLRVYPHQAVAFISIAKLWFISLIIIGGIITGIPHLPKDLILPAKGLAAFITLGSILFAFHQLLHYSHTHLTITKEALIYKKGWVPSTTDNIFWVNIKDINTECSVTESLLGTGSIVVVVAIRTAIYQVKVSYLPHHEKIAEAIREQIGALNENARQITYT